jgi:hypothetical protein
VKKVAGKVDELLAFHDFLPSAGAPAHDRNRSVDALGPGDTTFPIIVDWGLTSCRGRRRGAFCEATK